MNFVLRAGSYRTRDPSLRFRLDHSIGIGGECDLIFLEGPNGVGKTTFLEKVLLKRYRRPVAYISADTAALAPALSAHLTMRHWLAGKAGDLYDDLPPSLGRREKAVCAVIAQPEIETLILDDYGGDYGQMREWLARRQSPVTVVASGNDIARRAESLTPRVRSLLLRLRREASSCVIEGGSR